MRRDEPQTWSPAWLLFPMLLTASAAGVATHHRLARIGAPAERIGAVGIASTAARAASGHAVAAARTRGFVPAFGSAIGTRGRAPEEALLLLMLVMQNTRPAADNPPTATARRPERSLRDADTGHQIVANTRDDRIGSSARRPAPRLRAPHTRLPKTKLAGFAPRRPTRLDRGYLLVISRHCRRPGAAPPCVWIRRVFTLTPRRTCGYVARPPNVNQRAESGPAQWG